MNLLLYFNNLIDMYQLPHYSRTFEHFHNKKKNVPHKNISEVKKGRPREVSHIKMNSLLIFCSDWRQILAIYLKNKCSCAYTSMKREVTYSFKKKHCFFLIFLMYVLTNCLLKIIALLWKLFSFCNYVSSLKSTHYGVFFYRRIGYSQSLDLLIKHNNW